MKLALFRAALVACWAVVAGCLVVAIVTAAHNDPIAALLFINTGIATSCALDVTFKYRDRPRPVRMNINARGGQ